MIVSAIAMFVAFYAGAAVLSVGLARMAGSGIDTPEEAARISIETERSNRNEP